jgi:hypothetical protein
MNELVIPIEKVVVTASQPKKTVKKKGKPRGESKTSVRRLAILAKQMQALEYRKMGFTYQMIADELGYQTAQGASAAIMTAIELTMKEPAGAVLALELERLDALMAKPYQAALNGDLVALNSVLAIMNRRARYLGYESARPLSGAGRARQDRCHGRDRNHRQQAVHRGDRFFTRI